jgi:hypothetical protein
MTEITITEPPNVNPFTKREPPKVYRWCLVCQRNIEPDEQECVRCKGQADMYDMGHLE